MMTGKAEILAHLKKLNRISFHVKPTSLHKIYGLIMYE